MFRLFALQFFWLNIAFAFPISSEHEVEYDRNLFVLKGDILEINPDASVQRNLVVDVEKLWEEGVVPFYIDPKIEEDRGKIYNAMNHISNRTCIRFRAKNENDPKYIHIYNGNGCFAYIGRLGNYTPVSLAPGCLGLAAASHEILHSLGVHHEQSRSDRDDYITVHFDNMHKVYAYNYRKLNETENQLFVPFDFDSVMLYGPYMGSANGEAVMTANDPNQTWINTYDKPGLSELDIKALNKLYKCERYGPQFAYDD